MEFKQALSVQLKFLHLHDKVLTAAFTQKKETDRGLTPARTTLAVTASTKRWSEKHLSLQCNVLLETPGPFCRPSTRQSPPPPAGQHTWPNHKNCSGMCEEHDEDLKALNSPPNSPDPNLMAHVCRNEFDSWRPPPRSPQDPESMSWFYMPKNIPRGPVSVPRKVGASLVTQHEPCGFTILYCCNGFH